MTRSLPAKIHQTTLHFKALFGGLPFGLALRMLMLHAVKRGLRVPVRFSFSQTGEDLILSTLLPQRDGFYVDVGANDPVRYSNTFFLYKRGWRGVAIDANQLLVKRFAATRRRDTCVAAAVSNREARVTFHRGADDLVSTIHQATLDTWQQQWEFRPEDRLELTTRTLTSILHHYLPGGRTDIDLLCIDVEGHEFEVLSGLDFSVYRPRIVVIEAHDLASLYSSPSHLYLIEAGYSLVAFATMNAYYRCAPRGSKK